MKQVAASLQVWSRPKAENGGGSQEHRESVLDFDSGPWVCLSMVIGLSSLFTILKRAFPGVETCVGLDLGQIACSEEARCFLTRALPQGF